VNFFRQTPLEFDAQPTGPRATDWRSKLTKIDAIIEARKQAKATTGYAYAVETINGWVVSANKPMLRMGQVIEVTDTNGEYIA
jgi:hypothetical protein